MQDGNIGKFLRFTLPFSSVVAVSLGIVVLVGAPVSSPGGGISVAKAQPADSAEVASYNPYQNAPSPYTVSAAPQTVFLPVESPRVAPPQTAVPVYGNVDTVRTVYNNVSTVDATPRGSAAVSSSSHQANPADQIASNQDETISVGTATINVGTATINVLSSFKLNYGGKTIVTGSNGQVTSTP